jgi:transcriptional regulator with XRE-family HTH domain
VRGWFVDILVSFGRAVKLRRVELNLSQEALADKASMARSFISGVERGATKASTESVWRLAEALNCRPSDLWITAERLHASP